jgi:hypothetical protein
VARPNYGSHQRPRRLLGQWAARLVRFVLYACFVFLLLIDGHQPILQGLRWWVRRPVHSFPREAMARQHAALGTQDFSFRGLILFSALKNEPLGKLIAIGGGNEGQGHLRTLLRKNSTSTFFFELGS